MQILAFAKRYRLALTQGTFNVMKFTGGVWSVGSGSRSRYARDNIYPGRGFLTERRGAVRRWTQRSVTVNSPKYCLCNNFESVIMTGRRYISFLSLFSFEVGSQKGYVSTGWVGFDKRRNMFWCCYSLLQDNMILRIPNTSSCNIWNVYGSDNKTN